MKPQHFAEVNVIFAKDQPQYQPLPSHRTRGGRVTTCWRLSWHERLQVLFRGQLWMQSLTFGNPLQPLILSTDKPHLEDK